MAEYIEREKLKQAIAEDALIVLSDWDSSLMDLIMLEIEEIPAADVAPVVRCKDCKHLRLRNQKDLYGFCSKTNIVFLPFELDTRTHFCSYGAKMDGGTE